MRMSGFNSFKIINIISIDNFINIDDVRFKLSMKLSMKILLIIFLSFFHFY